MFASLPRPARDFALLGSRIILGVILMAHGWQKFTEWGISGTTANFDKMGVPMAQLAAPFTATIELVGGLLLILGLFTPIVSLLVIGSMVGAWFFAHRGNGIFASNGGGELVWALAASALALLPGAGRFSLDYLLFGRKRAEHQTRTGATTAERELADARR
ncbi:DoxX family protein [Luteococcus peritonei]|uniref:DoxX family protein n=1 Tax=Luteococcus peritonei TaxID=88874 RepID=A0ABW4RS55_9ACTN